MILVNQQHPLTQYTILSPLAINRTFTISKCVLFRPYTIILRSYWTYQLHPSLHQHNPMLRFPLHHCTIQLNINICSIRLSVLSVYHSHTNVLRPFYEWETFQCLSMNGLTNLFQIWAMYCRSWASIPVGVLIIYNLHSFLYSSIDNVK